jgi:hypothetical protein
LVTEASEALLAAAKSSALDIKSDIEPDIEPDIKPALNANDVLSSLIEQLDVPDDM